MKATLEFNLPEDQEDFELYNRAIKFYLVLTDLAEWFRSEIKYSDPDTKEKELKLEELERARDKFYAILEDRDTSLD